MSQIRDYIQGVNETQTLVPIEPNDGTYGALTLDGSVYKNGFSDLLLYADSGGVTALVLNTDYELSIPDEDWTTDEVGFSDKTVYSQFRITNVAYQSVTVWATFTNFGVYTSADANFDMVGGSEAVTTSAALVVPFGHTRYRFNFDSTAGDIAPTMPNGAFDGQQVILNEIGGGNVAYVTGAGIDDILYNESHLYTWNSTDSVWLTDATITEYASNSSTTDADDTTSFVYGVGGSEGIIGNTALTGTRKKRVNFKTEIKTTDNFSLATAASGSSYFFENSVFSSLPIVANFSYLNTAGGIGLVYVDSHNIDIFFWETPFGNNTALWNNVAYSGVKWRVSKVSHGN